MMLTSIRKSRLSRLFSGLMTLTFMTVNLVPVHLFALTSGPSQPETQQFAPAGMDNMVDPFSGDFSYNIPLVDVGGYPVNLNYAAGITPDQEASWVGLGWNLNVGAVNRSVRGLPDDFAGDEVVKEYHTKPNETVGINGYIQPELWGVEALKMFGIKLNASLFYNNYNGFGMTVGMNPSLSASLGSKSHYNANLGLNLSVGSEDGVGITPSVGIGPKREFADQENTVNGTLSFPFSSKEGLKGLSLSASYQNGTTSKETKQYKAERTASGSAFYGFGVPAYTPFIESNTYSINASTDFGVAFLSNSIFEPDFGASMYYNGQFLEDTKRSTNAYGYLHSGLAATCPESQRLMDFNREKDGGGFNKFTVAMPLANHTYDIFSVSGQGVGGAYRAYRGDIGTVSDIAAKDRSYSPEAGFEMSIGALPQPTTKVGFHFKCNVSNGYTGTWQSGGSPKRYSVENITNTLYEPVYFKKMGEMAPDPDKNFVDNSLFGDDLLSSEVVDEDGGWLTNRFWLNNDKSAAVTPAANSRSKRNRMNTRFTALTASEVDYNIYSHQAFQNKKAEVNTNTVAASRAEQKLEYPVGEEISRVGGKRKGHHLSEVRVTDHAGARYVYGIPAYNNLQEETTFDLDNSGKDIGQFRKTGLASYDPEDVGTNNSNGLDHFFSRTTTYGSASAFLLTQILSSDYVDSDQIKGASDGDLGNYTKFNYTKTHDAYRWRTPYQQNMASFNDGKYGSINDDKGNYVYGEKEVWYLHSIETRTHVAEFYLGDRLDGLGVAGRDGGMDLGQKLKYLKRIELYSKQDRLNGNTEPLKVVYFDYDYSLCPNTPNSSASNKGKLTLKKVWFTYGNALKGIMNPYVFNYAENFGFKNSINPSYNIKDYDKWGQYKPEDKNAIGNEVFPYVDQNKAIADSCAGAFALSSINTPTGGTMQIYYESDDYGYVQNRQAMEMFHVKGIGDAEPSPSEIQGYAGTTLYDGNSKNNLIIKLNKTFVPATGANAGSDQAQFIEKYVSGIDRMYFKMKVQVLSSFLGAAREEFVPGYASIVHSECKPLKDASGQYNYALIKLGTSNVKNKNLNHIILTSLSYLRLHLSRECFGSETAEDPGVMQIVGAMLSMTQQIAGFITGFNNLMLGKGNCSQINPAYSFVRLKSPDKIKLGGGHRVKAIVMKDNWGQMKSDHEKASSSPVIEKETSYYGQFYDYSYQENTGKLDQNGKSIYQKISAGVAAYEPQLGGDENPFRQPIFVTETALLAPSKEYYLEEPFGESFFPGPSVGYKKIRIVPLKATEADLASNTFKGNGTGYIEQEFYTAQDFPTIVQKTDITPARYRTPLKIDFIVSLSTEKVTTTQGYYIETNDMHGKEKSKKVVPDPKLVDGKLVDSEPISYVEYQYKTNGNGRLVNTVPYVDKELKVSNAAGEMGVEVDVTMDQKYSSHSIKGGGAELNPKGTVPALPLPFALFGFTVIPSWVDNYSEFKYLITTKVVSKHGILEKTIAKDNGQTITTQNLAWDAETGKVLLTQVENEFHDKIWSFTYPGHWAYEEMGLAYQNEGLLIDNTGLLTSAPDAALNLQDGDEFLVKKGANVLHGYINKDSDNSYKYINKEGAAMDFSGTEYVKIFRSGHRNVVETPVGTVACLDDPRKSDGAGLKLKFDEVRILNAGATQYKHVWKKFCNCLDPVASTNPFVLGQKAVVRPWRSWTYLTNRVLSTENNDPQVRRDGYFADFTTFWNYNTSTQLLDTLEISNKEATKWQYVSQIENYNPVGMEIVNKDALGRFTMAQFGYGRNLPVGTSNNSRYKESGFDNFEDYDYGDCKDDHFSWRVPLSNKANGDLTLKEAHTGKRSLKVMPGRKMIITKVMNPCNVPTDDGGDVVVK